MKYYYNNGKAATMRKFNLPAAETLYRWVRKYETVGFMRKGHEKRSAKIKLEILKYFWEYGPAETETKYQVSAGTLHVWNNIFEEHGFDGLKYDGRVKRTLSGIKFDDLSDKEKLEYLMIENEYLKKLDALVTEREKLERKKK